MIFSCSFISIKPIMLLSNFAGISVYYALQVGFGLYPVIVKKFASNSNTNPVIFSFYRDLFSVPLFFLCVIIVERKFMFPQPKMLLVCIYIHKMIFIFIRFLFSSLTTMYRCLLYWDLLEFSEIRYGHVVFFVP